MMISDSPRICVVVKRQQIWSPVRQYCLSHLGTQRREYSADGMFPAFKLKDRFALGAIKIDGRGMPLM